MNIILSEFEEIRSTLGVADNTAALILLSYAIRDSATFNRLNAENFGHELALALKNVVSESVFRTQVE